MGRVCNTHGDLRIAYEIYVGKPERRGHLELGMDGKIILVLIVKRWGCRVVDWIHLAQVGSTVMNLLLLQKASITTTVLHDKKLCSIIHS